MERRRWTARGILGLAGLALLVAAGCSSTESSTETDTENRTDITQASEGPAQSGGSLSIGLTAETGGWDPVNSQWAPNSYLVANSIFDPLAAYDEDGVPQPYLAESIESTDDFTEWTITLRDGITFHDGTDLTADVLVDNLEAHRASALTGQAFRPIDGVAASTDDPMAVVVTMTDPWSTFPQYLAFQPGYVAAPSQLESEDAATDPVGTGPFEFENWVQDSELTVVKNDSYWRDGFPLLDEISYKVLADTTSRGAALDGGDVDMIQTAEPTQILDFEAKAEDGEFQLFVNRDTEAADLIVALNTAAPPFDNPLAREAVATGIDRQRIVDTVFEGLFEPAQGLFHPDSDWYTPDGDYPAYDPARATELADQYEAETGSSLSFTLSAPSDPFAVQVAELGQQMLGDVGIDMEIRRVEQTALILDALGGNYEATAWTFLGGSHPDATYIFVHGNNTTAGGGLGLAITGIDNEAINDAMDQARSTDDEAAQIEQWNIVQAEMAKDMGYLYIVHTEGALIAQNLVRGVTAWDLPDGTPGIGQEGTSTMTYQLWLDA